MVRRPSYGGEAEAERLRQIHTPDPEPVCPDDCPACRPPDLDMRVVAWLTTRSWLPVRVRSRILVAYIRRRFA